MSNIETPPVATPPAAPPAAPSTPEDYKALYEAEAAKTADLIEQRNRLKPAQQMLNNLTPQAAAEVIRIGQLAGAQDMEGLLDLLLENAEGISGKDIATLVAERQRLAQGDPVNEPKSLSAEDIAALVDQRTDQKLAAREQAQQGEKRVTEELAEHGYKLKSAAGMTIINHAVDNNVDVKAAVEWFEKDTASTMLEKQQRAAAAAATVPAVAPTGTPAATQTDGKRADETDAEFRRRSAIARLTNSVTK